MRDPETGAPARNPKLYEEVLNIIRESKVDMVLNFTAGMGGDMVFGSAEAPLPLSNDGTDMVGATERLEHVRNLLQKFAQSIVAR